jgi:hypothetical protein
MLNSFQYPLLQDSIHKQHKNVTGLLIWVPVSQVWRTGYLSHTITVHGLKCHKERDVLYSLWQVGSCSRWVNIPETTHFQIRRQHWWRWERITRNILVITEKKCIEQKIKNNSSTNSKITIMNSNHSPINDKSTPACIKQKIFSGYTPQKNHFKS